MIDFFTTDEKARAAKRAPAKVRAAAKPEPTKKPTKHGREVNRLLRELGKFDWDEEAMKRA